MGWTGNHPEPLRVQEQPVAVRVSVLFIFVICNRTVRLHCLHPPFSALFTKKRMEWENDTGGWTSDPTVRPGMLTAANWSAD